MNVFMPFQSTEDSVQSLDNKRLCKQVLECMQLIKLIEKSKIDNNFKSSYLHHPVTQYYKDNLHALVCYAFDCVVEYQYRFGRHHVYHDDIMIRFTSLPKIYHTFTFSSVFYHDGQFKAYDPFLSTDLFKIKLCEKWIKDFLNGRPPKWSDRITPKFFISYIKTNYQRLEELGQDCPKLKKYILQYKEN